MGGWEHVALWAVELGGAAMRPCLADGTEGMAYSAPRLPSRALGCSKMGGGSPAVDLGPRSGLVLLNWHYFTQDNGEAGAGVLGCFLVSGKGRNSDRA